MKKFTLILAFFILLIYSLITSVGASSIMWSQTFGGVDYDSAEAVIQTRDGGYTLAGMTKSFSEGVTSFGLLKQILLVIWSGIEPTVVVQPFRLCRRVTEDTL